MGTILPEARCFKVLKSSERVEGGFEYGPVKPGVPLAAAGEVDLIVHFKPDKSTYEGATFKTKVYVLGVSAYIL